jgi:hypothetical protein
MVEKKKTRKFNFEEDVLRAAEALEEITVHWSEERFAPMPYNSFAHGNFFYKTKIKPDETAEEAFERAFAFLDKMARKTFLKKRDGFYERFSLANQATNDGSEFENYV